MAERDFLDMGFITWIGKYGDEKDKDTLRGSGFPTQRDRELSKRAYKRYMNWIDNIKDK